MSIQLCGREGLESKNGKTKKLNTQEQAAEVLAVWRLPDCVSDKKMIFGLNSKLSTQTGNYYNLEHANTPKQ